MKLRTFGNFFEELNWKRSVSFFLLKVKELRERMNNPQGKDSEKLGENWLLYRSSAS